MSHSLSALPQRRTVLFGMAAIAIAPAARAADQDIEIWKSPTCGCCAAWAEHLAEAGFNVRTIDLDQDKLDAKKHALGVPDALRSCHTALVDGYVVEGHVPARDIKLLLTLRPSVQGLAVPGMPIGSPGMEMGATAEPFDTLAFERSGATRVFAQHG